MRKSSLALMIAAPFVGLAAYVSSALLETSAFLETPASAAPSIKAGSLITSAAAAVDLDPDPSTVVVELEARETEWEIAPGHKVRGWSYNGQVPGPTIEANVGDTVVIRLKNHLPESTTIHWHGLRVPAAMDGTEVVQRPVAPGETFEYRFVLPDAGTFWYHPHAHETVQMERGLYGALVVRGPDEPRVDAEKVLVLDDLTLDRSGQIAAPGKLMEVHDGREGGIRLINGRLEPTLRMNAGQIERWRLVNASSARYVRLSVGGLPFRILGTDGGLLEAPETATEVLLTPGDRYDIAVGPFPAGRTVHIAALPFDRGTGERQIEHFAALQVGASAPSIAAIPQSFAPMVPLATGPAVQATREVHLGGSFGLPVKFLINGEQHHHGEPVKVGELQVWDVYNDTLLHHPFHLHGFFFQVIERDGQPVGDLSLEDTVNVPPKSRIRIAWMPDDRPGSWMYHCHILEHAAAGMMAHFEVVR